MATRRTVPVEIDIGTVALAELAAARHGMPVAEWIARAARRELVSISPTLDYVELTEAEMLAEDARQAALDRRVPGSRVWEWTTSLLVGAVILVVW
ncbi:MAG: hypothetical protein ACRDTA_25890 [Pseudonocardiaceae bacterium]